MDENKEASPVEKDDEPSETAEEPRAGGPLKVGKAIKFLSGFRDWNLHVGFVVPGTQLVRVLPAETIQIDKAKKAVVIICLPEAPRVATAASAPPHSGLILPPGYRS